MNTSGEKVPSCPRSEGSPSSEYEVSLEHPPPPAPCFLGLIFFQLSWRQQDARTPPPLTWLCGAPPHFPSDTGHWAPGGGGPLWLCPLSLPVPSRLPAVHLQCFLPWFAASCPAPASVVPPPHAVHVCTHSPVPLRVLGLRLKAAWALCPVPSPAHSTWACMAVREDGRLQPHLPRTLAVCPPPLPCSSLPGPAVCTAPAACGGRLTPSDSCASASRCVPPAATPAKS